VHIFRLVLIKLILKKAFKVKNGGYSLVLFSIVSLNYLRLNSANFCLIFSLLVSKPGKNIIVSE